MELNGGTEAMGLARWLEPDDDDELVRVCDSVRDRMSFDATEESSGIEVVIILRSIQENPGNCLVTRRELGRA